MKSKTSSSKAMALRKDLSRFWPVWVGYTLALALIQITICDNDIGYWYAANMAELASVMGFVNMLFALVSAQMLFGDLYSSRLCSGIHSLPLKRREWFRAHVTAGFLFSLIPTALIALFSEGIIHLYSRMEGGWQIPLYWFAAANIQYIFFFGLGVFCVLCAGNRLGATLLYGVANSFSLLFYLLADQLYAPLLFGVIAVSDPFEVLCPVFQIVNSRFLNVERMETPSGDFGNAAGFSAEPQGWIYIGILAVLGLLLLLLARGIYKKRHLETAGDFMAVRWLEWPFQVVFAVLCAAGFHAFFLLFFGLDNDYIYILLAIGLIAGWFAGRMFLERTTRVFRLKNILRLLLLSAVLGLSLFVTHLDPLGISARIPEAGEVQSVTLRMNYRNGYTAEAPEEIEDLLRLHGLALEQRLRPHPDYSDQYYSPYAEGNDCAQIILEYCSPGGWRSRRDYYISAEGESAELMKKYCSRLDVLLPQLELRDAGDLKHEMKGTRYMMLGGYQIPEALLTPEFLDALAQAIAADAASGSLVQSGAFHPEPIVEADKDGRPLYYLNLDFDTADSWGNISIYADCENILGVLEPTGILDTLRENANSYY